MKLSEDLAALLGPSGWVSGDQCLAWQRDWLDRYGETPLGVARPKSTNEVSKVIAICADYGVSVVPQGGNTSLTGAAVLAKPNGVILSLSRMNKIAADEPRGETITVEAGVVLAQLHKFLEGTGLTFPLHIGSEGSAQIGGLIATNAGGSQAFRFGMMQDLVLGLEVVLPDGKIWNGMRRVLKDNAGYQLKKVFSGSEGTLGVVTRAVLKLAPEPSQQVTALLAVPSMSNALDLLARCRAEAGEFLTAIEFFSDVGLEMALAHIPDLSFPLTERAPFYILIEAGAGSPHVPLENILSAIFAKAFEDSQISDCVLAMTLAQRQKLWLLREEQPEGQRREGLQLKHDISVPPESLASFLERAATACDVILDGVRINPFGHLADGNVHYNLSPPPRQNDFLNRNDALAIMLAELATSYGGSFAAEHGLGRSKVSLADRVRDPLERRLMQQLKSAFDPSGGLNPGVIITG